MCEDNCQCYWDSDEYKDYKAVEEQIGHCSAEQARAMYSVSAGVVREHITLAVMEHITKGNKGLRVEFPEFALEEGDHESG